MSGNIYDSNTDNGTARALFVEQALLHRALTTSRPTMSLHAMVVKKDGRTTKLLTRCDRAQREAWLDGYFGLDAAVVQNIDVLWGVAFRHPDGHIVALGNDHQLKAQAIALLKDEGLRTLDGDLMTIIEVPSKNRRAERTGRTPFAYSALSAGEQVGNRYVCFPDERQGVLELNGVLPRDPAYSEPHGYAWRCDQNEPVILAFGSDLDHTTKAVEMLCSVA